MLIAAWRSKSGPGTSRSSVSAVGLAVRWCQERACFATARSFSSMVGLGLGHHRPGRQSLVNRSTFQVKSLPVSNTCTPKSNDQWDDRATPCPRYERARESGTFRGRADVRTPTRSKFASYLASANGPTGGGMLARANNSTPIQVGSVIGFERSGGRKNPGDDHFHSAPAAAHADAISGLVW